MKRNYKTITNEIIELFEKGLNNDEEVKSFSSIVENEDTRTLFSGLLPEFFEKMIKMDPEKGLLMFDKLIVNSSINNIMLNNTISDLSTEEKSTLAHRFVDKLNKSNLSDEQISAYATDFVDAITLAKIFSVERMSKEAIEEHEDPGLLYYFNNRERMNSAKSNTSDFLDLPENNKNFKEQIKLRSLYSIFLSYHSEEKKEKFYKRIIADIDTESYKFKDAFLERVHAMGEEKGLDFAEEMTKVFEKAGKPIKSYHEMHQYSVDNNLASEFEFIFHKEALKKYTESIEPRNISKENKLI